jgi:hypothetical protein
MTAAHFVAADTAATLRVQCLDLETGDPVSLSGATVAIRWRIGGRPAVTRAMTVVDSAQGLAEYTFAAGELVCGVMRADVAITTTAGVQTCAEEVVLEVRPKV